MARPCIVNYCGNIGCHRLPKDETRRADWLNAIQHIKPKLTIRRNSFVCSAHFRPEDFVTTTCFVRPDRPFPKILKKNTVPSVFAWRRVPKKPRQHLPSTEPKIMNIDKLQVRKTYSRAPQFVFVEMPLAIQQDIENTEDPLQGTVNSMEQSNEICENIESQPYSMDKAIVKTEINLPEIKTEKDTLEPFQLTDLLETQAQCKGTCELSFNNNDNDAYAAPRNINKFRHRSRRTCISIVKLQSTTS